MDKETIRRLQEVIEGSNIRKSELARSCGLSLAAFSEITSGKRKKLSGSFLTLLKLNLQVNPKWITTGRGRSKAKVVETQGLQEREMIKKTRKLNPENRSALLYICKALVNKQG